MYTMMRHQQRVVLLKKLFKISITAIYEELIIILQDLLVHSRQRVWIRKWLERRSTDGASNMLLKELAIEDVAEYRNCMRMSPQCFAILLQKIVPAIQRSDTTMRMEIPAKTKLEITLSYLATGNSYRNLSHQFRVSRPAFSKLIPEVCDAIYEALKECMKVPQTTKELKTIESDFNTRWNFPGCYGAIDVNVRAPANAGSEYFNYKGHNSIILMAVLLLLLLPFD